VTTIFPTKNEESTIENSVNVVMTIKFNAEVIVVDAYSSDRTADLATKAGAILIQQPERIFGKGNALKGRFERGGEKSSR
jgi:glycosyltransferase involved in cell wall biosynthesis